MAGSFSWDDAPELMTCQEVASLLRASPNTTYELARSGLLRDIVVQVGRQKRFPKNALRRLLEG
jgi:excisionase family DNA binding protein